MSKSIRKAVVVAMVMGGAAATPMAASALEPNLCSGPVEAIGSTIDPMTFQCSVEINGRNCGKSGLSGYDFLWDVDKIGLRDKVDSALGKIATTKPTAAKYDGAERNLREIALKVDELDTADAKTKLSSAAANAILAATKNALDCFAANGL